MKTIRFFLFGILLMAAMSLVSCRKDPSVPTGKVFNAESGGDNTLDSLTISIIANPNDGGRVYGGGTYQKGQECTVIASPNDGYTFINWRENDSIVAEDKLFRFTVVSNRTLVANFTQQEPQNHTISVSANPSDGGTITGGGTYQDGETCMVTAMANEGYIFSNWTENGIQVSTSVTYSFTVNTDRSLVANFSVSSGHYTITAVPSPMYGGVINGSGTYIHGNTCTLTAISNEGYTFTHWTENGNQVSDEVRYSFTVIGNRTLVAHFATNPQSFTVSVSANPSNGGIVTGNGAYQQGQQCTVTATANSSYIFTNWTENDNVVSTNTSYTFTVDESHSLVANFDYCIHSYVDLGLPSGILWATCNVGANAPEEYGNCFAWGETGHKDVYKWSTYKYCMGSLSTLTKYCNNSNYGYNGFTDNLITLLPEDDAATVQWGDGWYMPTKEEWNELFNNTTNTWTMLNGVYGRLFTSSNGNSLFLPAAGQFEETGHFWVGTYGYYWSSSLNIGDPFNESIQSWSICFTSDNCSVGTFSRNYGHSIRPVRSSSQN